MLPHFCEKWVWVTYALPISLPATTQRSNLPFPLAWKSNAFPVPWEGTNVFFRNFWTLHSWTASMNTHVMSFLHMSRTEMFSSAPHPMTVDCEGLSAGKTPNINPWSTTPQFNNRVRAYFDRKSSLFYHCCGSHVPNQWTELLGEPSPIQHRSWFPEDKENIIMSKDAETWIRCGAD